jgi:hypothetical protein
LLFKDKSPYLGDWKYGIIFDKKSNQCGSLSDVDVVHWSLGIKWYPCNLPVFGFVLLNVASDLGEMQVCGII